MDYWLPAGSYPGVSHGRNKVSPTYSIVNHFPSGREILWRAIFSGSGLASRGGGPAGLPFAYIKHQLEAVGDPELLKYVG